MIFATMTTGYLAFKVVLGIVGFVVFLKVIGD